MIFFWKAPRSLFLSLEFFSVLSPSCEKQESKKRIGRTLFFSCSFLENPFSTLIKAGKKARENRPHPFHLLFFSTATIINQIQSHDPSEQDLLPPFGCATTHSRDLCPNFIVIFLLNVAHPKKRVEAGWRIRAAPPLPFAAAASRSPAAVSSGHRMVLHRRPDQQLLVVKLLGGDKGGSRTSLCPRVIRKWAAPHRRA